jgi:hypothetical protein
VSRRGKEEISSSDGADNTQPAKVISTTTQGRNLGLLNSHRAPDYTQGITFLDSQRGVEEVFQGVKQPDAAINPRMTQGTSIPIMENMHSKLRRVLQDSRSREE